MEDLRDPIVSGPSAMSIEAELKDDLYLKLVDDFLGSQTGDLLDLDEKPCTNRLLVQVGLMREDKYVSWISIIKWLQKIFPMFHSADFRGLIDRNIETALSLAGEARENFLQTSVNFDYVGPICDSIGIGRTDLLKMADFSDRAKLTDVTNGLILELTNFIAREKIDPIVLVSWLRNFDSTFCSDGRIQKANKLLQASLKRFRMQYRNNQRSRNRRSGLFEEFLHSLFDLTPDQEDAEFKRMSVIKGNLKRKHSQLAPSNLKTMKIKEEMDPCGISPGYRKNKGRVESDSDSNKTSCVKGERDSWCITSEFEKTLDLQEATRNDRANYLTLLDICVMSLQTLTNLCGESNDSAKLRSMELLKSQFSLIMNTDLNMRSLNEKILEHTLDEDSQLVSPLTFLQCNSLFLFNFIDAVEKQVMSFEREIVNTTGDRIGRDKNPKFKSLLNFDESVVTRYVHMACEILCPRRKTSNNYRKHWLAFCLERDNPSRLPVKHLKRFINYFEAAAALVHHCKDVVLFVSDLQQLNDDSNIFLDSVNFDAGDEVVQALVCVVAVVYCKVLGPFWQLLKSDAQYMLFSKCVLCLYEKLLNWTRDASPLLEPEAEVNIFLQVPKQEKRFSGVFAFCHANANNQYGTLMKACLQRMMKVLAAVVEENLKDFLPDGKYCKAPSVELADQLASCTLSQLMGKHLFEWIKYYDKNLQDKDFVNTEGDVSEESDRETKFSLSKKKTLHKAPAGHVRKRSGQKLYMTFDRANLRPLNKLKIERTKKLNAKQEREQQKEQLHRKAIIAAVVKNGGPCNSAQDVDLLVERMEGMHPSKKREAVRYEINYQRFVVGRKDRRLKRKSMCLADLVSKLKSVLPSENSSACLVTMPTKNVIIHIGSEEGLGSPQEEAEG